jgi:hypothetical protein
MDEADVMTQSENGETALHLAADQGHTHVLKVLVHESDITTTDNLGLGAIHLASRNGHVEVVDFLVQQDPSLVRQRGASGRTALHEAATLGHLEIVKRLLEHDADIVDMTSHEKETALHCAVKQDKVDVVKWLINRADVSLKDKNGQTAEGLALTLLRAEIIKCFAQARDPATAPGALERQVDQRAIVSLALPDPIPPIKTPSGDRFLPVPGPARVSYRTNSFTPMPGRSVVGRTFTFSV